MAVSAIGVDDAATPDHYLHYNARTISAVSREDQYVLPGQNAYPTYIARADGISIATVDSHVLQIMADGTNYSRLLRYWITATSDGPVADTTIQIGLVRLTTAGTGGSAVTPAPYDTADTYAGGAMTLPSSKGTESTTLHRWFLNAESAPASTNAFSQDFVWEASRWAKPIIFGTGTGAGLCWKVIQEVASCSLSIHAEFVVSSFL